jgi:hypothetical protein
MLYQLSYALRPHYQVSTFGPTNRETDFAFNQRQRKLLYGLSLPRQWKKRRSQRRHGSTPHHRYRKHATLRLRSFSKRTRKVPLREDRFIPNLAGIDAETRAIIEFSHLSRITVSLTWGTTHSSLRLLHWNRCNHLFELAANRRSSN